ncbi:MAG: hypothetical protein D0531_12080 [Methylococcales bacterium]|nr:MAG: hypothetical protein D0531_12080 [Methylococcales bacterium]
MKRNKLSHRSVHNRLQNFKHSIAFHEAGHAIGICLNNQAKQQQPVFFQIVFKEQNYQHDDLNRSLEDESVARIEGGRLIQSLIYNVDDLTDKLMSIDESLEPLVRDYQIAFDADIINLLIGPLAEAKQAYLNDDEQFNYQLIDIKALKNYGGDSDLALAWDYLESYSKDKQKQDEKLNELFIAAGNFISDSKNWLAITKLADYIIHSDKEIIRYEEVISLLNS